jgi:dynein heavy chain
VQDNKSSQITLLISLMFWCTNVEKAMLDTKKNSKALDDCTKLCQNQLEELIKLVQGKIDKPMRTRAMCMITLDTHARDISGQLHVEKCFSPDGFQWQAQLKAYYNQEKKDAEMHICDAVFVYG